VFSSLGFYPVCPGTPEYVIGSPLFEKVQVKLPNGKTLTIEAPGADQSEYIQKTTWDGKTWDKSYFNHNELLNGGSIHFEMGSEPNKKLWNSTESFPSSVTPFIN
jgi:putative alpha-1,2-mannosidase